MAGAPPPRRPAPPGARHGEMVGWWPDAPASLMLLPNARASASARASAPVPLEVATAPATETPPGSRLLPVEEAAACPEADVP